MERGMLVVCLALVGTAAGHTQIGFSASMTSSSPVYVGNIVKFNSLYLNRIMDVAKTGFVTTSGHWVCPISGDYQINLQISAYNRITSYGFNALFYLYRSGSLVMRIYAAGNKGSYHTATGASNIVYCTKGQSLYVSLAACYTYSCSSGLDMRYSYFSGYLLRASAP